MNGSYKKFLLYSTSILLYVLVFNQVGEPITQLNTNKAIFHSFSSLYDSALSSLSKKLKKIKSGEFHVTDTVCVVETDKGISELSLMQKWPVRNGRPYSKKLSPDKPLITGQRVIDCLFPIA